MLTHPIPPKEQDEPYQCPHCGKKEHVPNPATLKSMRETDRGLNLKRYTSVDDLLKDLEY